MYVFIVLCMLMYMLTRAYAVLQGTIQLQLDDNFKETSLFKRIFSWGMHTRTLWQFFSYNVTYTLVTGIWRDY